MLNEEELRRQRRLVEIYRSNNGKRGVEATADILDMGYFRRVREGVVRRTGAAMPKSDAAIDKLINLYVTGELTDQLRDQIIAMDGPTPNAVQ